MRSLMRVSSVEIAASPLGAQPPTRKRRRTCRKRPPPHTGAKAGLPATDRTRETSTGRRPVGNDARPCNPTSHRLCTREDTSVSSLWTPSGEHRPPESDPQVPAGARLPRRRSPPPKRSRRSARCTPGSWPHPVEDVVANHALGIWQLALVHLGVITPPDADGRATGPEPGRGRVRDRRDGRARSTASASGSGSTRSCSATRSTQAQMLFVDVSDGPAPSAS